MNITGAAREPEIADLIGFLRAAGADISGAGTSSLQICGVSRLHGATYTILPDRIETATYLCMAAGCGGETELLRCDARLLLPVIERLREAGCEISADADRIVLRSSGRLLPLLPGFYRAVSRLSDRRTGAFDGSGFEGGRRQRVSGDHF